MKIKTLKTYQENAVANALEHWRYARSQYDVLPTEDTGAQRRAVAAHQGCLLIEAPTGSGKTLMAAHVVEEFSREEGVVWFWFAPFKGVVGQTVSFLKEQSAGLRVRDLTTDRQVAGSRAGDAFVTTWQTVAVRSKEKRTARKDSEQAPGTDTLLAELRKMGLRIGVVVDEAHHSFQGQGQAAAFYREVLAPDYTLLITATPDDRDIDKWKKDGGIAQVHRISVSRDDAVAAGLVKAGVSCISFIPDPGSERLVDMEMTCLRSAAGLQTELKAQLKEAGVSLTPLLMVQVDSSQKDSPARAKEKLMACGFREEAIAIHTADEPDAGLMGLANNEQVEVLIFKMAVALGFDAPRAFTLVSMRAAKDEDFGVQLLGRILRVHRRLQGKTLPALLNQGYVLLANSAGQEGLKAAGIRMNALRTEMDKTAPTVTVMCVGGQNRLQATGPGGQTTFFQTNWNRPMAKPGAQTASTGGEGADEAAGGGAGFQLEWELTPAEPGQKEEGAGFLEMIAHPRPGSPLEGTGRKRYCLKAEVPRRFMAMRIPEEVENLEEECARYFSVEATGIVAGMIKQVSVQQVTLEVFTGQLKLDDVQADLSPGELARRAQEILSANDNMSPKELRAALRDRLKKILMALHLGHLANDKEVPALLDSLLVWKPGMLLEAQKKAIADHAVEGQAEDLPEALEFDQAATPSLKNVYGIYPPGLGGWEQQFAQSLDAEREGIVRWWHRNEPRKPHSLSVLLSSGGLFYPDFVIGIEGRKKKDGILMADPHERWEQEKEHAKVLAEHPSYGRALILSKAGETIWLPIVWDQNRGRPKLAGQWDWNDAAGW